MTTPFELIEIAQRRKDLPAAASLLTSLAEGRIQARMALAATQAACSTLGKAADMERGYSVGLDHSDFVAGAARASAALSRMASDLMNLACVLTAAGEDVSY